MRIQTLFLALLVSSPPVLADVLVLTSDRDNSIYEEGSDLSNGDGDHFFAGKSGASFIRRGLFRFDLSAIPPGSVVNSVSVRLYMSRTTAADTGVALHRVVSDWGEGTSHAGGEEGGGAFATPGDATWSNAFHPSMPWATPGGGGDFVAGASASTTVGGIAYYTWTSPALVADVQAWIDGTFPNHGWITVGEEALGCCTAKRFDSHENPSAARRPRLTIDYTPSGACCFGDGSCAQLMAADCATAGGSYGGDNTFCYAPAEVVRAGTPPNPTGLLPGVTSPPVIGQTWDPVINPTSSTLAVVLAISPTPAQLNVPTPYGVLLCNLPPPHLTFVGTAGVPFAVALPLDCTLPGAEVCAQGIGLLGLGPLDLELYNALDLVLGHL